LQNFLGLFVVEIFAKHDRDYFFAAPCRPSLSYDRLAIYPVLLYQTVGHRSAVIGP